MTRKSKQIGVVDIAAFLNAEWITSTDSRYVIPVDGSCVILYYYN